MTSPTATPERILANLRDERDRRQRSVAMAEEYSKSFSKFLEAAWPTIEPAHVYLPNWHIDAICSHMQAVADGHIKRLLITVPPGSAKSLIVSVAFPAWMWTPLRNPGWRATFASYDAVLSSRDSVNCRNLLSSIWFQETFRPQWKFASDQNVKTYFVNTVRGHRFSTSVGAKSTGFRGDAIMVDDPIKAGDRNSEPALAEVIDWWTNEMVNRLNKMDVGVKVIIMQRLGDRDLAGHVLREGGYTHLKIPMRYDPSRSIVTTVSPGVEWSDPRKMQGELMFPQMFSEAVVQDFEKNQSMFASQYQQEPNAEGGGILKSSRWQYWQPAGLNLPPVRVKMPNGDIVERVAVDLPDSFDIMLASWDCTFKDLKTSDFVCGQVHAARGARRFILDQVMRRMGIVDTMAAVRELTGRHPKAHLKLVEDKANGTAVVEMLQKEVPGLVLVEPKGGKVARAAAASPELEAGNWFLPHPMIAPWVGNPENPTDGGFLASTVLFPFGANDDDVDAWTQGAIRIQQEKVGGVFGVSEADLRVDPFDDIGAKWPRLFGMAVTWREVAAVWMCRRPETDQHYLYAEYCVPPTSPQQHAAEILKPGDWIQGVMTAKETGRDEKDGYALIGKYRNLRLKIDSLQPNEESMLLDLQDALVTGKLKVFGSLPALLGQLRMYRRTDDGKLPDRNDGLIKAMYVAWAGRAKMKGPAEPAKPDRMANMQNTPPKHGWMQS